MKIPKIEKIHDSNTQRRYEKYSKELHFSVIKEYLFNDVSQEDLDVDILGEEPRETGGGYESNNLLKYYGLNSFKKLFMDMSIQRSILELKSTKDSQYDELISILKKLKCRELHSNPTIWSMNISTHDNYDELWKLFHDNSLISIDYLIEDTSIDYSPFETEEEITEHLNEDSSNKSRLINRFVNEIKKGDIFIAHKGSKILSGIGLVESDYIHQNEDLSNIRKIEWFYSPNDLKIKENDFFDENNLVKLNYDHSNLINEFLARIAAKDKNIRNNLLKFLFNKFFEEYHLKEISQNHFEHYDSGAEKIQNEWRRINEKKSNNEEFIDDFWNNIFHRDLEIFSVGGNSLRNRIQSKSHFTDRDMDNLAIEFINTVNDLLESKNVDDQKESLDAYCSNSYGIQTGIMSPILFYLDKSKFYPINSKTIKTVNLLSVMLGIDVNLSDRLNDYIDSNEQYKNFLKDLKNNFYFDKLNISDIRIFDEFCHWICDNELGYYIDERNKVVNILPIKEIFRDNIRRLNMFDSDEPRNLIYFGAPGTGKSFCLNNDKDKLEDCFYERVTFHPDYSYANFVGTYKPVPKDDEKISYKYVPGPFMRLLVRAYAEPTKPFLLIIEEINRSNIAAVFGDVFQLLDRDEDKKSRFPIQTSEDMREYLKEQLGDCEYVEDFSTIEIPSNLFIWATMNSADQGVFPMDTAFKRRWEFKYLDINAGKENIENIKITHSEENDLSKWNLKKNEISWNDLRIEINNKLLELGINEDKLMGPFFAFNEFIGKENKLNFEKFKEIFKNKVIMYLYEDAAKIKRKDLFKNGSELTYSKICKNFEDGGPIIFCDDISKKFINDNGE